MLDREEVADWILPNDFDHSLIEAKHLVHETDANRDGKLTKDEILEKYSVFVASTGMYIMYIRCILLTYCIIIILSLYLNLSPIIKIISYFYIKNLNLSAGIIMIGLRIRII